MRDGYNSGSWAWMWIWIEGNTTIQRHFFLWEVIYYLLLSFFSLPLTLESDDERKAYIEEKKCTSCLEKVTSPPSTSLFNPKKDANFHQLKILRYSVIIIKDEMIMSTYKTFHFWETLYVWYMNIYNICMSLLMYIL